MIYSTVLNKRCVSYVRVDEPWECSYTIIDDVSNGQSSDRDHSKIAKRHDLYFTQALYLLNYQWGDFDICVCMYVCVDKEPHTHI